MLTEKQGLQFYQQCQFSSHPSQATVNALDDKMLFSAGYYSCICLLHATKRRHAVAFALLLLTHLPSNIPAIKIKSPSICVSRLQCVCSDRCMVWQVAVHTPLLKYHFSPWREGTVEVGYWLSDVPGWALHHTPCKMDRENTLPPQRLIARSWLSGGINLVSLEM